MYKVMVYTVGWQSRITSYVVTDRPKDWNDDHGEWPEVVKFEVSLRHDAEAQLRRAEEYCDYLNSHLKPVPAIGKDTADK